MNVDNLPSGADHDMAPEASPQAVDVTDLDALHASFYRARDPEPDMAWVEPFLDPDALGVPGLEHVSQGEWEAAHGDVDPCNDWLASRCMCKGACSCHWKQEGAQ